MKTELNRLAKYCGKYGWPYEEKAENTFYATVPGKDKESKILWIVLTDGLIEFSIQSDFSVAASEDFVGLLSTFMLNMNSKVDFGFWCIEELNDRKIASMMHNEAPEDIDQTVFKKIVDSMLNTCSILEETAKSLA